MLSNKNNLRSELTANVGVLATTISITAGEGVLWENNMVACLEHYEGEICTKREIIKITAKNNDTFTITRGFAVCIMNDQTKQQGQGSQEFVVGDYLSLYLSKEIWESLTVGITTNETNIQTMVARITAPRTCINNCCQSWKNSIDTAYVTKYGGNAGFGTGADGDCVISQDTFLDASCEYNFNNLTICEGVTVRFCGIGVPTINVWKDFVNCGVMDMRAPYLQARTTTETDCWLACGCQICNQCDSLSGIASEGGLYCGGSGAGGCADGCGASDGHGGNGGSGASYSGCNGGAGGTSGCYGTGGGGAYGIGTGGKGGSGSYSGGNGGNGYYGGAGGNKTGVCTGGGGAGGIGVIRGGNAGGGRASLDSTTMGNGGDAITNVYGLHLNARNIYNNCVDASGGDGGNGGGYCRTGSSGGYAPTGGCGGNGADGGQMMISYASMCEQGCFDVSGGKGGSGGRVKFTSESYCRYTQPDGTDGNDGWVVYNSLYNNEITDFSLENDEDNEAILISWKDPSIKQSSSTQRAKTVVRYSTTNYPTTPTDGTLAVQSTVKDQYEINPYSLTGVLDETTYYFTAFAIDQNNNIIDSQTLSITTDFGWHVTPNTLAYWNFDDQNASQITDATGNGRNLTGSIPTYALLSGTDYYGIFNGTKGGGINWGVSDNFTIVLYMQIRQNRQQYFLMERSSGNQFSLIYGYKSGQIEIYREGGRFTIKSSAPLNTRIMIGITKSGSTVKAYYNGQFQTQGSTNFSGASKFFMGGSNQGDNMIGYLNNVILEQGIRSDSDFASYRNKTKSKYGLS